jgi:hypothetical protein
MGATNKFQHNSFESLSKVFDNSRSIITETIKEHLNQEKVNGVSGKLKTAILELFSRYYIAMIKAELDSPYSRHLTIDQIKAKYSFDSICEGFAKHKIDIKTKLDSILLT